MDGVGLSSRISEYERWSSLGVDRGYREGGVAERGGFARLSWVSFYMRVE